MIIFLILAILLAQRFNYVSLSHIPESVISSLYLGEIAFNINDLPVKWLSPSG